MSSVDPSRILSIQSHVASGYVGNRAATFPLQLLGYDVDVVNTVHFSNHTGYGCVKGQKTTADGLDTVFEGLRANGIGAYAKILTGYIPGAEALEVVEKEIMRLKRDSPDTVYVLDPVMGDVGRGLYVSPDVVPVYRRMLHLADIVTPNQFEVELLSNTKITDLSSLRLALSRLHTQYSLRHIAFSSIPLKTSLVNQLQLPGPPESYSRLLPTTMPEAYHKVGSGDPDDEVLVCFASSFTNDLETWAFALPTIDIPFTGTGDLLSALCTAWFAVGCPETHHSMPPLAWAVSKALLTVQQVLLRTYLYMLEQEATPQVDEVEASSSTEVRLKARSLRRRELRLVPERALIADGGEGWKGKPVQWDALKSQ